MVGILRHVYDVSVSVCIDIYIYSYNVYLSEFYLLNNLSIDWHMLNNDGSTKIHMFLKQIINPTHILLKHKIYKTIISFNSFHLKLCDASCTYQPSNCKPQGSTPNRASRCQHGTICCPSICSTRLGAIPLDCWTKWDPVFPWDPKSWDWFKTRVFFSRRDIYLA